MSDLVEYTGRPVWLGANPVHRFYTGGARWRQLRGISPADDTRWAEDWVASCIDGGAGPDGATQGVSRLAADTGVLLRSLIEAHAIEMLGKEHVARWGTDPMVQVKLVAPRGRVPLHVHPDGPFAAEHLHSPHGKAEAWIVLDAPGTEDGPAYCGIGLREEVSPDAFMAAVRSQDRDFLIGAVHHAPIAAGDVVYIAPGVPHFISGGTLFVEIQEPADLGFLLEWRGYVDDALVATGGLDMELALSSVDGRPLSREAAVGTAFQTPTVARRNGPNTESRLFNQAADRYFEASRLEVQTSDEPPGTRYHVVVITSGRGWIEGEFGREVVATGDTLVLPAAIEHRYVSDRGPLQLLRCFPPSARNAS